VSSQSRSSPKVGAKTVGATSVKLTLVPVPSTYWRVVASQTFARHVIVCVPVARFDGLKVKFPDASAVVEPISVAPE